MKLSLLAFLPILQLPFSLGAVEREIADTVSLDAVEITAIKQGSNVGTLPLSATQIGSNEADRLGITAIKGLSDVVPNFFIPDYGSKITSSIYVRGLGSRMDQPSVGLNVDNVPVLNKDAYDFDIVDIAHIDMLRGPQSTLYGRNTMCGLINITTLSPFQYQGLRLRASYSSGITRAASVSWYAKTRQNAGVSISANYNATEGFYKNLFNNKNTGREQFGGARAAYVLRNSKLSMRNVVAASYFKQHGYPYQYVETGEINYNDTCFYHRFLLSDGLTLNFKTASIEWSSVSSVQYINDNLTLDQDFLPLSFFTLTQKKRETAFSQDIVAKGVNKKWQWLTGFFFFYKHTAMDAPVTFKNDGIANLIEKHRNDANPYYPIAWRGREFTLNSDFTIPTFGLALYHNSTFNFGSWFLDAGIRGDFEQSKLHYDNYCNTGYDIYTVDNNGYANFLRNVDVNLDENGWLKNNFIELLPKIAIGYNLPNFDNSSIYMSVAKGYKAGGFNTQMFSDVLQQKLMGIMGIGAAYNIDDIVGYKPEKSWNYELGAHINLRRSHLKIDASLFYIDCRDQQLTMFPDGTTTGRIMTNAGKTRSCGAEMQLSWTLSQSWLFRTSYGFTDARFRKFYNGKENFARKKIPYAPSHTLFGEINWNPLSNLRATVYVRATGEIYWNEANSIKQPFYALLGADITWQLPCDFSISIWGENLTDTHYNTFYFVSMGNEFLQRGKPCRVGVTLQFNIDKSCKINK